MHPSLDEYKAVAKLGYVVPIFAEILADVETPLSIYWKLSHDENQSFLLESVTGGEHLARYSLIGVRPQSVFRSNATPNHDPLEWVRSVVPKLVDSSHVALPKFVGGAVGMISYDYVSSIELIQSPPKDDLQLDDVVMMQVNTVVVFDHAKNTIKVVSLAGCESGDYEKATREIQVILDRIAMPLPKLPSGSFPAYEVKCNREQSDFENAVEKIKEYIREGDGIQMVPSMRASVKIEAHPVTIYRSLRSLNPSPFMYLLRFGDFDIVGASPELLVSLSGREAAVRPIAGTRSRGATFEEDNKLAASLLADEKERAEHIMLVDLGRNDLGRVCKTGTVQVQDLMTIEKYSHVMHIVSSVRGTLQDGLDGIDLVRATFPAGTVSGAPKVRAMQIINELEPTKRGLYAGAVGYFSTTGDLDLAIAIRTILIKNGTAYVQAGAGIVYDSVPELEWKECWKKARAPLTAIELAQKGIS